MPLPKNYRGVDQKGESRPKSDLKPRDLDQEMYEWAVNEMKFMPQGRHADKKLPGVEVFQKLCRGKGYEFWEHIISHVKSAETVNKIKMNLALSGKASGENEEAAQIKRHHDLMAERDLLRSKVEKQQVDMEKLTTELKKSENDLSRLEGNYQSHCGKVDEIHQRRLFLSAFNNKCLQEKRKIEDYQGRLTNQLERYKQLLTKLNDSSQFYSRQKSSLSDDTGLESACTKDVREACDFIAEYLADRPNDPKDVALQQQIMSEKITKVMVLHPAGCILASLIEVTNESALDIQLQTQAINISDDVKKLKFKQETSGELTDLSVQPTIHQTVDQLIEKSQLEHLLRFTVIQKHKNSVHNLEKQLAKVKQDCHLALQQNLGGLPDMLELTKMVLESEIGLAGSMAGLKCLQRLDNELTQRHARIEMEKVNLHQKYQRIQDFNKVTEGKQNLIKALVRQKTNTPGRLQQQKQEILIYIDQSLRNCRNNVTTLAANMTGNILNEMKIFGTVSIANLPVLVLDNMSRVSRLELEINKFRPEIVPQNDELVSALVSLDFPFHQAPELLLQRCIELQETLSDFQRHATAREVPDCARTGSKMADVLAKVDRHDQLVRERMLPKMERCLQKTAESLADCIGLKTQVEVWWEQPGQYTAPWVMVDGKTFQEYKDQWTILCTRLRQLQRC